MGKRVVGRYFLDHVLADGVHACIYLFTVDMEMEPLPGFTLTSWERGYGDMKLVPDMGTWRRIPWLKGTALVFCDVYTEEGKPIEEAPRWVLRRQVERAAKAGYVVQTASELERFYLFRESFDEARAKRYHGLTPVSSYLEDYHILQTGKEEGLVRAIRNGMEGAGVPVEFSKGEWGKGQEEINLRYAPCAGDGGPARALQARRQGDRLAAGRAPSPSWRSTTWARRGPRATFTPRSGTSGRARASSPAATGRGAALFQHWLAGQMAMARDFALLYAPTVNSYKRYQAGSFAPTRVAAGWDNRTCGFRICGEGSGFRVENRIPGADANPYLAFAATIAAGLHGIDKRLKGPKPYTGNAYEDARAGPGPEDLPRGSRHAGAAPASPARPSAPRWSSTTYGSGDSSSRPSTRSSPTGN